MLFSILIYCKVFDKSVSRLSKLIYCVKFMLISIFYCTGFEITVGPIARG